MCVYILHIKRGSWCRLVGRINTTLVVYIQSSGVRAERAEVVGARASAPEADTIE